MYHEINCPKNINKCEFLSISPLTKENKSEALKMIKDIFPRLNEMEMKFWSSKIDEDETMLMMKNGTSMIGIMTLGSKYHDDNMNVNLIGIRDEFQGKSLGGIFIDIAEKLAKNRNKKEITLMTERNKPQNVAFYSKKGYLVTALDENGYKHSPSVHFLKRIY